MSFKSDEIHGSIDADLQKRQGYGIISKLVSEIN